MVRNFQAIRRFCAQAKLRPFEEVPGPVNYNYIGSLTALAKDFKEFGIRQETIYKLFTAYNKKYGPIYRVGIPGIGKDKKGTIVYVSDPNEYMKVLNKQPHNPHGAVMTEWPFHEIYKKEKYKTVGIFEQGDEWRRIRQELQKGITGPKDARRYVPSVVKAAQLAVEGFGEYSEDVMGFCTRASFDMISSIALGQFTQTADPNTACDPKHVEFQKHVLGMNEKLIHCMVDPKEVMMHQIGWKSKAWKNMNMYTKQAFEIGSEIFEDLVARAEKGEITEFEENSYAIQNYLRSDSALSKEEVNEVVVILLIAGMDTTSASVVWSIIHLAKHPDKQEKLYEELISCLGPTDSIQENTQFKAAFPYLTAILRESFRCTPAISGGMLKTCEEDIEVGGYNIPAGQLIAFNQFAEDQDPNLVDNPEEFRPERWLDDAVKSRKGTPSENLDHRLHAGPFSAGARMCPGARVANMEKYVLLSEIFRKWKVTLDPPDQEIKDVQKLTLVPEKSPKLKIERR